MDPRDHEHRQIAITAYCRRRNCRWHPNPGSGAAERVNCYVPALPPIVCQMADGTVQLQNPGEITCRNMECHPR